MQRDFANLNDGYETITSNLYPRGPSVTREMINYLAFAIASDVLDTIASLAFSASRKDNDITLC